MATVAKIVSRALRLLGVLDPNEALEAEDAETAIEALNDMCNRWEANGQAFGWSDVSNPSEEMPSPKELNSCIAYNLACELAAEYEVAPNVQIATIAGELSAALRRDNEVASPIKAILDVPTPTGARGAFRLNFPEGWN